ncbi:MAG: threonyl-tRNA synthetase [Desulfomicrobiaceae bacterium]|nr:threonyl-tRNA synthetase [Desulfomicrobiaceae bacterium]MBZ4684391.1 threonyl-tRNA synthetase [Desulfomicrobiaceae bacterium]
MEATPGMTCRDVLAQGVSKKAMKEAVACLCDGEPKDLDAPLPSGTERVEPVFLDSPLGISILRHSAAHIMAEAVKRLYPEAKVTIGPDIENGFYYDFDLSHAFTPEDLERIEAVMRESIAANHPFVRREMSATQAREYFRSLGETYKIEIIDDLGADMVSVYQHGDFVDLCRGPHLPSTGFVRAFKLTAVAGAYWRGDANRPMLQRIYGTAFPTEKALKAHLAMLEEAKKRDHRKLGPQLDLFSFHERGGAGMAYWHPKGALVRAILEDFVTKEMLRRGYGLVRTPQILRRDLWETSGHYANYRENMYFTEIDGVPYGVKPMNCVAHMLIYTTTQHSYRDLPVRLFEFGVVHRHELSGVLHGLLRVRQFTQDDAHIICRPDQLLDEIKGVMRWIQDLMGVFGFEYRMELSTRPEKSIGTDEDWERATSALRDAMAQMGLEYSVNEGDGAFYGPKIDVKLRDCLGREWQCSTIQVDFTLPERFDLAYIGEDGERHRPVMVHRAIMGSVERFIGILVEHFAGAFPLWLAPEQVRVLTVTDRHDAYAFEVVQALRDAGMRAEADTRNEKLGYKVREAQMAKVPYAVVIGDEEVAGACVSVRQRGGANLGTMTVAALVDHLRRECAEPFTRGGMRYSFHN